MTTEIQRYQSAPVAPVSPRSELDSWINAMGDVVKLAEYIAQTEFVPEAMRGRPAAVAAAILTGREMNLEPMTALRHIHVVKGKPGLSAELMRAQVQARGHEIEYVETTDSRCVVQGRRRGESQWTRVTFTADQARRAKIDLGGYPEDKLVARATSRLCRRKFADCIAGLASVDELEDGVYEDAITAPAPGEPPAEEPKRTARRRATATRVPPAAPASAQPAAEPAPAAAAPPLPGEDGYEDDTAPAGEDQADETAAEPTNEAQATRAQLTRLHATLNDLGVAERVQKLDTVAAIVGRPLGSSADLTKDEAGSVIDTLSGLAAMDEPAKALDAYLGSLDQATTEDGE